MRNPASVRPSGLAVVAGVAPKPRLLAYDNKDDRTFIHTRLLSRLPPRERVRFLEECCLHAAVGNTEVRPRVGRDTYRLARLAMRDDSAAPALTNDVYSSLWVLALQYRFDADAAMTRLEERVRWLR